MEYKPFDPKLNKQNDPPGRKTVKEFFRDFHEMILKDNEDIYGIDLLDANSKIEVEVERRHNWRYGHERFLFTRNGKRIPFSSVHIPLRKEKFINNNSLYAFVSKDLLGLGLIFLDEINKDRIVHNSNKYINNGEYFFDVPSVEVIWYKKIGHTWYREE